MLTRKTDNNKWNLSAVFKIDAPADLLFASCCSCYYFFRRVNLKSSLSTINDNKKAKENNKQTNFFNQWISCVLYANFMSRFFKLYFSSSFATTNCFFNNFWSLSRNRRLKPLFLKKKTEHNKWHLSSDLKIECFTDLTL